MIRCIRFRPYERNHSPRLRDLDRTRVGLILRDCVWQEKNGKMGQLRTGAGMSARSLTCLHEINDRITKLREQAGKPPFDDGMPPERNTGFLIVKQLMISE
jgi:hypothetical protein